jgi:hypothetical protein
VTAPVIGARARPCLKSQLLRAMRLVSIAAVLSAAVFAPAEARYISFSGRSWTVIAGSMEAPAAPNRFSADERSVWVDTGGRLHLRLRRDGATWYSAEVACARPLGYGTYSFVINADIGALDPNAVVGLFTWSDDDAFANHEIDIEFSRWGDPAAPDAQFAVQPYTARGHLVRFNVPRGIPHSTYAFRWAPASVTFAGYADAVLHDGVPPPGDARVHINIWLAGARPPINKREEVVVIDKFIFTASRAQNVNYGMGSPDFRVGGRIFATLAAQSRGYGNLMLTPERQKNAITKGNRKSAKPLPES